MKVVLGLSDPEEQFTVEVDARDRRAFERAGANALGLKGALQDEIRRIPDSYIAWLSWHAARRTGLIDVGYDDFDKRLTDIDPDVSGVEDPPTGPAT